MDENAPEAVFNRMMEKHQDQQNAALKEKLGAAGNVAGNNPLTGGETNFEEQKILNELQTQVAVSTLPATPAAPSQGQCPQCNLFHPPVAAGEKCPNAPVKVDGISESQVNEVVVKVKDILASQLEQKSVKDFNKFSGGLIVELMKYCEGYEE